VDASLHGADLEIPPFTEDYGSVQFEERRPHRGCVDSAAALRAYLQGSQSATSTSGGKKGHSNDDAGAKVAADVKATKDMPQYHGPAREAVMAACKTLELECNCSEPQGAAQWDDTVALLAGGAALGAVETLVRGCGARIGDSDLAAFGEKNGEERDLGQLAETLEKAVNALQSTLEKEAKLGCDFVKDELAKKEAELMSKEAEKAKRIRPGRRRQETSHRGQG